MHSNRLDLNYGLSTTYRDRSPEKISDRWNADMLRLLGNARCHESAGPNLSSIGEWMKKLCKPRAGSKLRRVLLNIWRRSSQQSKPRKRPSHRTYAGGMQTEALVFVFVVFGHVRKSKSRKAKGECLLCTQTKRRKKSDSLLPFEKRSCLICTQTESQKR